MNTRLRLSRLAIVSGIALTSAASAQTEQWLEYRTSKEGISYRYLELTTNPPPNVALPKLGSSGYYARWGTPMDPSGGRWLCLERTRKAGLWDRLYIDSNGNGRLDDEKPQDAAGRDQYSTSFDPARVVFKGEDGPVAYHLWLQFMKYEGSDARLLARSAGWYEGRIMIGGKTRRVTLVDGSVNGTFNDVSLNSSDADRITVEGDKVGERFLGRLLEVDSQLYRLETARDGAYVKLTQAEARSAALGKVEVPDTIAEVTVTGENGQFTRQPAGGKITLPAGKYRVYGWRIDRKDVKGAAWTLAGYNFGERANFEVTSDKTASLALGEPVKTAMQITEADGQLTFSLRLQGALGESIELRRGGQNPRGPQLTLASLDGSYRHTNTFEFG